MNTNFNLKSIKELSNEELLNLNGGGNPHCDGYGIGAAINTLFWDLITCEYCSDYL